MPEIIPDHVPSPRTLLAWDGTVYRPVSIDAAGRLIVRGEDQLFGIEGVIAKRRSSVISGADGYSDSDTVPAGRYWIITNIYTWDHTSPTTKHLLNSFHDGVLVGIKYDNAAFALQDVTDWQGHVYLDAGDLIRVYFTGGLVGDTCYVDIHGYQMTIEV